MDMCNKLLQHLTNKEAGINDAFMHMVVQIYLEKCIGKPSQILRFHRPWCLLLLFITNRSNSTFPIFASVIHHTLGSTSTATPDVICNRWLEGNSHSFVSSALLCSLSLWKVIFILRKRSPQKIELKNTLAKNVKHCQRHNGPEGWVHLSKVT